MSDELNSVESKVAELLDSANSAGSETEKILFLNQSQELLIQYDILDNFLDEILGFQSETSAEMRKFVAGFIEAACRKEPDYFTKMIVNLNMLLSDEAPSVVKKTIQVLTQLYKVFLSWVAQSKVKDEIESTWEEWNQMKNQIISLIDLTENDGVRTQCVKFIEMVIVCQTRQDNFTTDSDFSLTNIISMENKLVNISSLEEEAKHLFEQLVNFQSKIHISSVNLMATMQSLALIARQRSKLFFNRVIQSFEKLSSNLPPTLAKSQVHSVQKQLKLLLLILFKHPFVYSSKKHHDITQILLKIGVTQSEINRCLQDVKKRGIKIESVFTSESKRIKIEVPDDVNESNSNDNSSNGEMAKFNLDSALYELNKKVSRYDAIKAVDITAKDLTNKLSDSSSVCELVFASLPLLPDQMPDEFVSVFNDNQMSDVKDIAKKLSTFLTSLGIGLGIEEMVRKYITLFESIHEVKVEPDVSKMITSSVKKIITKETVKIKHHSQSKVKLIQSVKALSSSSKIKQLKLEDITKPLELNDKLKFIESAMGRILNGEKDSHLSAKLVENRGKIIGKFMSEMSSLDNIKSKVRDYIFIDLRNRYDILMNALYFEYILSKECSKSLESYSNYLYWIIENIINKCEVKERDYFLQKFYTESPALPDNVIALLKSFALRNENEYSNCYQTGIGLFKILIDKRVAHRSQLLQHFLEILVETASLDAHELTLSAIKEIYQSHTLNLKDMIEDFSLKYLHVLLEECAPKGIHGSSESAPWNDDNVRVCFALYLNLLPVKQTLIHKLPDVYVSSQANTKRVILRLIQTAIEEISMNSPEILVFVQNCRAGSETLVSRVIHILTEKQPPSSKLVACVKDLYQKRVCDIRFLIPVLSGFSKKEIFAILPQLIKLNPAVVKEVFNRLLVPNADSNSGYSTPLSPADLMIALHNIDLSKCDLKTVIKATNICFEEKHIYTAEVLAVVMQMLLEQNSLPTLLMRTVIQTLHHYPRLVGFVMNNILQRLILKQVWQQKKVWEGFIKCCQRTMPQSFPVLLQLPAPQLLWVFKSCPEMKPSLQSYIQGLDQRQIALIPQPLLDAIMSQDEADTREERVSTSSEIEV